MVELGGGEYGPLATLDPLLFNTFRFFVNQKKTKLTPGAKKAQNISCDLLNSHEYSHALPHSSSLE